MKSIFWLVSSVAAALSVMVETRSNFQPDPTEVVEPIPHQWLTKQPSQASNMNALSPEMTDEVYESDILLTDEQRTALKMRKAIGDDVRYRWPEGPDGFPAVPYVIKDDPDACINRHDSCSHWAGIGDCQKNPGYMLVWCKQACNACDTQLRDSLDHWMDHTCIRFEETNNMEQPHLEFVEIEKGCYSNIGRIWWRDGQTVELAPNCPFGTIVHELGHAIGFYHEQSRSDRDDYVTILFDNILEKNREKVFYKANTNNYNVPYDYTSIMQYHQQFLSINNKPTMITKDILSQALISYNDGLSHRDKVLANRMYNCIEKWLNACGILSEPCLNDGYTGKNCTCVCPPGTRGSNCGEVKGDYYAHQFDHPNEHITVEKNIKIKAPKAGRAFLKLIDPPACKKAKMTFTYSSITNNECGQQNLYIKTDLSDAVGLTMCPSDIIPGVTLESSIGIIITMMNEKIYSPSDDESLWEADVTFEDTIGPGCPIAPPDECVNENQHCNSWAGKGECQKNPGYMLHHCKKACNKCDECVNENQHCDYWAGKGDCQKNPGYMLFRCKKACNKCDLGLSDEIIIGSQHLTFRLEFLSWADAASSCEDNYGKLATLKEPEKLMDYLARHYDEMDFWVGGSDAANEGSWVWMNGEALDSNFPWSLTQPDNHLGNQNCLLAWGLGGFDDQNCDLKKRFICEKVVRE